MLQFGPERSLRDIFSFAVALAGVEFVILLLFEPIFGRFLTASAGLILIFSVYRFYVARTTGELSGMKIRYAIGSILFMSILLFVAYMGMSLDTVKQDAPLVVTLLKKLTGLFLYNTLCAFFAFPFADFYVWIMLLARSGTNQDVNAMVVQETTSFGTPLWIGRVLKYGETLLAVQFAVLLLLLLCFKLFY